MSRRRRHRWARRMRPADRRGRAGTSSSPASRGSLGRRRRWFKPTRRPLSVRARAVRQRFVDWREAAPPLRFKGRSRPSKPARRPAPRQPRMRPRKSVVERVIPGGDPSPPRTVIRLRVMGLVVLALFSLMFVRLWYLQVLNTSAYARTVSTNAVRDVEVPAPRGLILDRAGNTMVGDQVTQDITLSRVSAQEHPGVVASLAAVLDISTTQIEADLANPQYSLYKPVPILENAPMPDVLYIGEHASQFPGVSTVAETNRTYPMGDTGAQMLGYMGQIQKLRPGYQLGDQVGLSGLEEQYETPLRGTPGTDDVEVDAQGNVVGSLGSTAPKAGDDLVTNIDEGLEETLQSALDAQIASLHSVGGAAVALDPQTGAVLALVSSPSYDPTWWTPNGISTAHFHQLLSSGALNDNAIDGLYTPGSTFKLATATAALQDGLISPGYTYDDSGTYDVGGTIFHDNDGEAAGSVNVTHALTVSSDIFFYNLGVMFWDQRAKYGETPIQDAANQLGWGEVTDIDLPGETDYARVDSPQVVAKEHAQDPAAYPDGQWFTGNNLEMAFGQGGTVVTPVEEAVAYATFANGGTRYVPEIGAGLVNSKGKVVETVAPKVADHVTYSPSNYQAILQGLEGVVQSQSGTGYQAFAGFPLSTFPIAGKTGTASVAGEAPTSWFVGFGPVGDPQYVITAVISGGGYGATASAPVVRKAFDYVVAHPISPVQVAPPPSSGPSGGTAVLTSATCAPSPSASPAASDLGGQGPSGVPTDNGPCATRHLSSGPDTDSVEARSDGGALSAIAATRSSSGPAGDDRSRAPPGPL